MPPKGIDSVWIAIISPSQKPQEIASMRKAFTLIELLVVIAIIAILAAILFPVFAQAKAAAKKTVALSNAKQQALAAIMYAGDVDDSAPLSAVVIDAAGDNLQWQDLIQPYAKNYGIVFDPVSDN